MWKQRSLARGARLNDIKDYHNYTSYQGETIWQTARVIYLGRRGLNFNYLRNKENAVFEYLHFCNLQVISNLPQYEEKISIMRQKMHNFYVCHLFLGHPRAFKKSHGFLHF